MNSSFKSRIKRVEEIAKVEGRTIVFIWGKEGETEREAIRRMEAEGKDIIFIMWLSGNEDSKGPIDDEVPFQNEPCTLKEGPVSRDMTDIHQEIEQTVKELKQEGFSEMEINSLLIESSPGEPLSQSDTDSEPKGMGAEINLLLGGKKGKWDVNKG